MWVWLALASSIILGLYDVAKKQALKRNGVPEILLCTTSLSALFLCPFLHAGPLPDHLKLLFKALLVSSSWISGLAAMKLLPLTTVSSIKTTRPVFVLLFSILIFGEKLNLWQWSGSIVVIAALLFLSLSSRKEGIHFTRNKGIAYMAVSVVTGVASALFDKYIMVFMEPVFVQSWSNVYIAVILALTVVFKRLRDGAGSVKITPDPMLLLIALLITASDFIYFSALKDSSAMLSVVSMIRRASVIVPFIFGIFLFREKNIRDKALIMLLMLLGIACIIFGS